MRLASQIVTVPTTAPARFGFAPDEIDLTLSTREAPLKWVVVVAEGLPAGRAVNAAICAAAATVGAVGGLLGPDVPDADGVAHAGLPWLGCTVLAAGPEKLAAIRAKAVAADDVHVADMPAAGQATRVYADFQATLAATGADRLDTLAISLVGPRKRLDRLVGGLPLLG
jgi:hypothetical protein